ncbi:hypothetical protein NQ318_003715 [Aromia moschata]|uniref:Uncharacterized protein n=1 Tax=Aromia moschata TaxID=1265417 RepID=A0AAV8YHX3_9CUCU|nr:hypothetical protein NQ318_003715 [Aromia moschata]
MLKYVILILFIVIISEIICDDHKKEDEDVFIPTHEWQSVKKGQKIPEGLHIRINLETGVTEAKLLDEKDKVNKDNALLEIPQKRKSRFR